MAAGTEGLEGIVMSPSQISMNVTDTTAWATAMNNLGIAPVGLTGPPLVSDPICVPTFDHGLGLMTGMAPVNPMMTGISLLRPAVPPGLSVMKEIIHCTSCTLFPANPNLPPPATRDRPPGCKTVFVGGLPENAGEDEIREVFEKCGEITAIRKSKKNFCHIRFAEEFMVDKAIYLSGYRMRLGSSTDKKDTGRLHVDFAQARDDFYEWECKQRMLAREERHRRMLEDEHLRPPSPAPIVHYSEHEASLMAEKLKDDSKFSEAISVLLAWFERGEVTRRSANNFYSMIQSANSHSRRLMSEKAAHEQEMEDAKERFKNALARILTGFEQIVAVFKAASKQKAWDHFTKAQRKNIDMWRKQAEEIRNVHSEELMGIRREEEMEMSDDDYEESPSKLVPVEESANPRLVPILNPQVVLVVNPQPVPEVNVQFVPAVNLQSVPVLNPQSVPVVNPQSVPVVNSQSVPVVNPQPVPEVNVQFVPAVNLQSVPVVNLQSVPVVNPQSVPLVNLQLVPVVNPQSVLYTQKPIHSGFL
ncbi:ecto-NOX disulfide-thiol exchanger 1-like [Rhincodon typus]|uniref:ecto-NOX disulfide-thiol exchanger 1-like n=1 Tax=Rhincodon typus TaxID=259920 RepID=UPI0009A3F300|nr:ecto-NOX disulfide-thiol exchanger 1-like [Rhincodon typus]